MVLCINKGIINIAVIKKKNAPPSTCLTNETLIDLHNLMYKTRRSHAALHKLKE